MIECLPSRGNYLATFAREGSMVGPTLIIVVLVAVRVNGR